MHALLLLCPPPTHPPTHPPTGEGEPVAHGDVTARVDALPLQAVAQRVRLLFCDAAQRRAAADGLVALRQADTWRCVCGVVCRMVPWWAG